MKRHTGWTGAQGDDTDLIPERDVGQLSPKKRAVNQTRKLEDAGDGHRNTAIQRQMVSKWEREILEDKYLRLYEENILLKKHGRRQEDKIKRMATKLLRLLSDKKKMDTGIAGLAKKGRDIETEEMLEDLHSKMRELERQNTQLKEKLLLTKQQVALQAQTSRRPIYGHVQARINTGIPKPPVDPRIARGMRVTGPPIPMSKTALAPRYGHSVLEETRAENKMLESVIGELQETINVLEQETEMLKEQGRIKEAEFEEDLLKIKQQITQGQRTVIQENIDVIRLQREVKEKSTKLTALQAQFASLDENLHSVKGSHEQVLREMSLLNEQLKREQNKCLSLQHELRSGNASQRIILELQERVTDLERECEILKEANEKLVKSAFDLEREREWRQRENALKVQIAQLEATLKADVGEKGSIIDRLTTENAAVSVAKLLRIPLVNYIDAHEKLQEEHKDLRIKYIQLKQEADDLRDKMRFFTKESAIDFEEIEEALMIVKQRKEKDSHELDFLHKVDDERSKDLEKLVRELRAEHADTIHELEKTRNLLIVQHKINKDYQMEVDAVTRKLEEVKAEYEAKVDEYAQLLDIRAARIRKLEKQLRDVAYGTRQYRVTAADEDDDEQGSDVETVDETVHLDRGENLFEIHISKLVLSPEALRELNDNEPNLFCTWEFYEYEIQSTPVLKGPLAEFKFTSKYIVKVDDFFLHYLQKDSCTLEVHQSFGTDYHTVAAAQLKMRDIVDKTHGRLHGTAQLTGVDERNMGMVFGTVEFWVRLRVPMEQAIRLYKERSKALGYIESNTRLAQQAVTAMDEMAAKRPVDNINELHIQIIKCDELKSRREGVQPSPYCMYKFFDFNDYDTNIVQGSNNPHFSDLKTFPVGMTADLDSYLKAKPMLVYVFDDCDPDETEYLGCAKVPLIPLAHDKAIKGTFELRRRDGSVSGTLDVHLKWQYTYIPPKASTKTPAQLQALVPEEPEKLSLLPGEEEALQQSSVLAAGPDTSVPDMRGRKPPSHGPSAASTPMAHKQPVTATPQHPRVSRKASGKGGGGVEEITSDISEGTPVPGESATVTETDTSDEEGTYSANKVSPDDSEDTNTVIEEELEYSDDAETCTSTSTEVTDRQSQTPRSPPPVPAVQVNEALSEDTMFEEVRDDNEEDEEVIEEEVDEEDGSEDHEGTESTAESEGVVLGSPSSRPGSRNHTGGPGDQVEVMVSRLSFNPNAPALDNDAIKMLFVEYRFLGVPPEETETPYSLPKPTANKNISFNFSKVFHVDFQNHYERRQYLASMLLPDDPDEGRVRFTVVSEPVDPDDRDGECEDVGVAFVSVRDILNQRKDIIEQDMPLYNVEDETTVIGNINLTVKCLSALDAVKAELQLTDQSTDRDTA
ncbi:hypothetical protein NP493_159g03000 [Ridgeia piscesae]|uniref:C2 domain-containing protein n=1 Tax=Ridgeia piscesae TaxID=27915 RepID=A0AAD9UFK2_RIDPI|nr:hypothetical protein NP493_159g03000 [Ridgeia piscesae]